jgi:uncharacterized repeat protein (TIGR01451 family)
MTRLFFGNLFISRGYWLVGVVSVLLVGGVIEWRVTAGGAAEAAEQSLPAILLVDDDDNAPDVRGSYTEALDGLGLVYEVWNTSNSDNEPTAADLLPYGIVIWFSGDEFGGYAGPGEAGETALAAWLDSSGDRCFFISSQDYLFDHDLTPFGSSYLGVQNYDDDGNIFSSVTGQGSLFGGLGPYTMFYPFYNWSDWLEPDGTAEVAFVGDNNESAAVNKVGPNGYRTTFWGFPFEAIADEADRMEALGTWIDLCSAGLGTLTGTVVDVESALPVEDTIVTADDGVQLRATITDGNGAYALAIPAGNYTVTASAENYLPQTVSGVVITTSTPTTVAFTLQGSSLYYTPPSIEEAMMIGEVVTTTVTVTNSGPLTLSYQVDIGGFGGPPLVAPQSPVSIPASDGDFVRGTAAPSVERAPVVGEDRGSGEEAAGGVWRLPGSGALAYGVELFDTVFVTMTTDNPETLTPVGEMPNDSFFGGDFLDGDFSTLYAVENDSDTLYAMDTSSGALTAIGPMTISATHWWTGMAGDPTSGQMYASSSNYVDSTLYTVDVMTGETTVIGTIPGKCLIAIAINAAGELYGVDVLDDELLIIDKTTAAVTTIGSLGFDANYAQGMDFDETADILYMAAFSNYPSLTGELRVVDTETGATTVVGELGLGFYREVDTFAIATGGGTNDWAYALPESGEIAPFGSSTLEVVFDSGSIYQEGDYTAELSFSGNFVNDAPTMPLTMHLGCAACGWLNGAISDVWTGEALTADIGVNGPDGFEASLIGDSYTLFVQAGSYTFTVTADGYISQTVPVVANGGVTVTTDFALTPIAARLEYAPAAIEASMEIGEVVTNTVTVTNTGTYTMNFRVAVGGALPNLVSIPASDGNFVRGTAAPSLAAAPAEGAEKSEERGAMSEGLPMVLGSGARAYGFELVGEVFISTTTDNPLSMTLLSSVSSNSFYGGDFLNGDFSTLYAVEDETETLYAFDTVVTETVTAIGPMVASEGQRWTGMAGDPTSGVMYASSSDCVDNNTLYTVNVATGAVTPVGTMTGICLIAIAINSAGEMYGVDIIEDTLLSIDKTTAAVTTIGSLGFDANYSQGMDFDETADILYLAAFNNYPSLTGELRIVDINTGATAVVGEFGTGFYREVDAFAVATGGGIDWAYAAPAEGVVAPGDSTSFEVVFDATSLYEVGEYRAELAFFGNFVNDVPAVPLRVQLDCPACAFLNGAISDAATAGPLVANIHASGPDGFDTTVVGSSYNLAVRPGSYTLTVTAEGYLSQTAMVTASQDVTTTTDFALTPADGYLDYGSAEFEVMAPAGGSVETTLVLSNKGGSLLTYELAVDQDWVNLSAEVGTLEPGEQVDIAMTFDASGMNHSHTYTATLMMTGNFGNELGPMPLVMHVMETKVYLPVVVSQPNGGAAPEGTAGLPFGRWGWLPAVAGIGLAAYRRRSFWW